MGCIVADAGRKRYIPSATRSCFGLNAADAKLVKYLAKRKTTFRGLCFSRVATGIYRFLPADCDLNTTFP